MRKKFNICNSLNFLDGVLAPNFVFLDKNFSTKKILIIFQEPKI